MLFNKYTSLKKVYTRSFLVLIMIPVLAIFFIAMSILSVLMRNSAIETMATFQNSVVTALAGDIRETSLMLTHFSYVNDGEFLDMAAQMNTADSASRYDYGKKLDKAFQTAMAPSHYLLSGMFYMKDGDKVYLKDELYLSDEEVKKTDWYQNAVQNPDRVMVGSYDMAQTKLVYSRQKGKGFVLVAAMAPSQQVEKTGKIEVAAFFRVTSAGGILREEDRSEKFGTTIILNQSGELVYGDFEEDRKSLYPAESRTNLEPGVYTQRFWNGEGGRAPKFTYVVSRVPGTEWKAVSYIPTSELTEDFNRIAMLAGLVICGLFVLFYGFSRYFLRNIVSPVHTMVEGLERVEEGDLSTHIEPAGQSEIRTMIHSFNRMVRQLKTSMEQNEEAQRKKHEAEVKALQSQINPHFLVNTLNSIRFMAQVSKFDGIRKMAEALIKIVSCSFRSNISFYTVKEELDVLDSYLYLMKIRYSDGFEVAYEVDQECLGYWIPRLILQPIVENSIVHGFSQLDEELGQIQIRVRKDKDRLLMEVEDNGKGMTEEEIDAIINVRQRSSDDNTSIGVENVFTRLKLNFKEACSMQMESEPGRYTITRIYLPLLKETPGASLTAATKEEEVQDVSGRNCG